MPVEPRTTTSHSIPRTSGEKFSDAELEKTSPAQDAAAEEYPTGASLAAITIGLFLAVLCFGLDRSILGTAIPVITSEFESLPDVAWYGSAYLFTMCSFQLFFGKLYAEFNAKWVFLAALFIFEVGSIVCAVAPSSVVLIVGRAISGVGAAGLMSGALIASPGFYGTVLAKPVATQILARSVPLHRRPQFTAAVGAAGGISQCIAPTLGGVFVDKATWRWCFWINLPLGGVTFLVVLFLLKLPTPLKKQTQSVRGFISNFDLVGTILLIPWIICLLLALQWGGTEYAWSNWRIILCWCLFAVCFLLWALVQFREGDKATVPFRILFQRSMACACWLMLLLFSLLFIEVYYIPIWLQAVKNHTAYQSGIDLLASLGGTVFLAVAQNVFHSRLISELSRNVPNVNPVVVIDAGGSGLVESMRSIYPDSVDGIIGAYNKALQNVFLIATVLGCLTVFGCVFIEWKSVKKDKTKDGQTPGEMKRDGDAKK
ncbi:hypothetical protein COL516b_009403 [Colletotrichum fioriniae]|nr:uncharacterized protein COL516b_009403 [Colletotrichum fioriniae]KAJ0299151.1 hypothetical protein COL516b_009403 [Colletotrichum fioriniae]